MIIFIKLGGSIITNKDRPMTPKPKVIKRLLGEIKDAVNSYPKYKILLGHGSGSFGHSAASFHNTISGVNKQEDWIGFQKVWYAADKLNKIVLDLCEQVKLPAISFSPCSAGFSSNNKIIQFNTLPIVQALYNGIMPIVHGDVIFDETIGATIFSTEDIITQLFEVIHPQRLLLVGKEKGVWQDYPKKQKIFPTINSQNINEIKKHLASSESIDVTGGMGSKVEIMAELIKTHKGLTVEIFSGLEEGNLTRVLNGKRVGTIITF